MKPKLETLEPRWSSPVIVAATGASLTKAVAATCIASGYPIIAVKQAIRRFPDAPVMYMLETYLWHMYKGFPDFKGEKWSAHCNLTPKLDVAAEYGLRLVRGNMAPGFSTDPSVIHYGKNSGFQAINLAIHWLRGPRKRIVLVGFDMQGGYFYGDHPRGPGCGRQWGHFQPDFERAAKDLPAGVEIVNATPGSLLKCFPSADLATALAA